MVVILSPWQRDPFIPLHNTLLKGSIIMKKFIAMILVVALTAAISVGATMAYLTDTEEDVNVMALGNVSIAQHEYERVVNADGTYATATIDNKTSYVLKEFSQAKPLYPVTTVDANGNPYNYGAGDWDTTTVRMSQVNSQGGVQMFSNANAQDKIVTVENTGKSDAYVRVIYAFEIGSVAFADFNSVIRTGSFMSNDGVWSSTVVGIVEIDGNNYVLEEAIYYGGAHLGGVHANGVLPAGETTYADLCQVYMTATSTNEDVEAIDGNGNGCYDILVFSQAVQTAGFANAEEALDTAFGDITTTNHPWIKTPYAATVVVNNAEELQAALDSAVIDKINPIVFNADIVGDVTVTQPSIVDASIIIDGNNHKFDGTISIKANSSNDGTDSLLIKNVHFETSTANTDFIWSAYTAAGSNVRYAHNITIENCTFTANGAAVNTTVGARFQQCYNIKMVNCTATNMHSLMQAESCSTTVTVDGCKVVNCKNGVSFNNTLNAVIKNTEIESVVDGGYGIRHKGEVNGYSLTVENCTVKAFVPVLIRNMTAASGYTATFTGTNALTATNSFGYQVVLAKGDWDDDAAAPAAPTGNYTLTGAEGYSIFGK